VMVVQGEEERRILHDRAAKTHGALLTVLPIRKGSRLIMVVRPTVRIQRGILKAPYGAATKLIGSRSRLDLDRSVATSDFRVDRRQDQSDFANKIRIDDRRRIDSGWPSRVLNHDAIAH